MKKILIISGVSQIGGGETALEEIANQLAIQKNEVHVIMGLDRDGKNWSRQTFHPKIKVHEFAVNFNGNVNVYRTLWLGVWQCLQQLAVNFDAVILNTTVAVMPIFFSQKSRDIKKIFIYHADEFQVMKTIEAYQAGRNFKNIVKKSCFLSITFVSQFLVILLSDFVITFSRYSAQQLTNKVVAYFIDQKKIKIISAGVNQKDFAPVSVATKHRLRKKYQVERAVVVLSTSRFEPRKGIDILIEAIGYLKKSDTKFGEVKVWLATSMDSYYQQSQYYIQLQKLIKKHRLTPNVKIFTNQTRHQLKELYQAADIHVLPSRTLEAFGLVALEALASGLPVVTFQSSGAPADIVSEFNKDLVVAPTNGEALAEKLASVIKKLPFKIKALPRKYRWSQTAIEILNLVAS